MPIESTQSTSETYGFIGAGQDVSGQLSGALPLSPLTSGEEVFPRINAGGAVTLAAGTVHLSYFTARKTEVVTTLRSLTSGTAAAGLTLAKMGVYSVATNGTLTRLAASTNDAALWGGTFTTYTKTVAGWQKIGGQRYAFAALVVGTTPPQLSGVGINFSDSGLAPRIAGAVSGQTDLPATIAAGSISDDFRMVQGYLLP